MFEYNVPVDEFVVTDDAPITSTEPPKDDEYQSAEAVGMIISIREMMMSGLMSFRLIPPDKLFEFSYAGEYDE